MALSYGEDWGTLPTIPVHLFRYVIQKLACQQPTVCSDVVHAKCTSIRCRVCCQAFWIRLPDASARCCSESRTQSKRCWSLMKRELCCDMGCLDVVQWSSKLPSLPRVTRLLLVAKFLSQQEPTLSHRFAPPTPYPSQLPYSQASATSTSALLNLLLVVQCRVNNKKICSILNAWNKPSSYYPGSS